MTDGKTYSSDLEAFRHLLEGYGSDRTRWPAPQRLEFAGLLASNGEAQRLYREAEAFDRLLDLAPSPKSDKAALVDRIAAAAFGEARDETPIWQTSKVKRTLEAPRDPRRPARFAGWQVSSVLAASLMIGAFAGYSGVLDPAVAPLVVATAASGDGLADVEVRELALDSGTAPPSVEDLL